jgi:hypothetical protein
MQHVIYDLISAVPDVSTSGALTAAKIALKAMPAGNPGEDQPNAAWRQHSASKADRAEWVTANEGRHVAGIADSFRLAALTRGLPSQIPKVVIIRTHRK